ncbi:DEAD/DEAH box helicase [Aurantimonas endophytica]|uniref:DNA repair protein RadD n=1 Tax=Aurantimonas endophytica TaxID=1522175 RepID=A0A7W6MQY2_9HYPH|nr:DEAD/DEAH box helicase [Aurantimonas endophytica]MBB4004460.1 DNA repair protein RadD [Aurantimonas endophytica]MCO6405296.1 DEAD/DEAH box helicase family protein [Aurantimonas endophytica]
MIQARYYQTEAENAVFDYWAAGGGNALVDLATGTGKSVVMSNVTRRLLTQFPHMRVLMLTHVKELVEQNFRAVLRSWPDAPIGLYSAGLGKRDAHHRVTFASIQSVFRKAKALGPRDLVLIDEAHLVPTKGAGMYRKLLDGLGEMADMRVCGFTATPFRLDSGRLDDGSDRLFDDTVYSYGIGKGIEDGYLAPLISKASASEIDVSNVQRRGGEFVAGSLEAAAMDHTLIAAAVEETIRYGADRRSWLVFCAGVKHAAAVRDAMRRRGVIAEMVTGETPPGERDRIVRDFREGRVRCLTNANVLTTGFDAPGTDLVVMLRSTLSTGLYVQIVGRGTRMATGKENCLVLDFAGNVRRHGPVDAVSIMPKGGGGKDDDGRATVSDVRAKECPQCETLAALNAQSCKVCGHEWPRDEKPRHEAEADGTSGILTSEAVPPQMVPVVDWQFRRWTKVGAPDSIRVDYLAGLQRYPEWIHPEHGGYPGRKAAEWWVLHGGAAPFPSTVDEVMARQAELTPPATISVKPSKQNPKFTDIVGRTFAERRAA